ncbi:hypothetical protein M3Y99_00395400 [Aphelenchoides fujianensis]|nr:hypothetical protein M3Y99_00395400 [Aphelenchoides fujianensis]
MDDEVDEQLPDVESGQPEVDDEPQADSGHRGDRECGQRGLLFAAEETRTRTPSQRRVYGHSSGGHRTTFQSRPIGSKQDAGSQGGPQRAPGADPVTKPFRQSEVQKPTGRPRGRPRKPVEKPTAVVRPTPRVPEHQPSTCKWNHCNTDFSSLIALKAHMEEVHFKGLSPFNCAWTGCDRLDPFPALYQLRKHLCRAHRREVLRVHGAGRREHTNEFPYQCTQCDKAFTNASDWNKHETRTHGDEKPFKCPVDECPKAYTDPSSLRKHMKKKHGEAAYEMASVNKRLNGAKGDYGFVPDGLNHPHVVSLALSGSLLHAHFCAARKSHVRPIRADRGAVDQPRVRRRPVSALGF